MKITKSGPEYTRLVLMQEPEWDYCKYRTCLNVGVETLQKLFDYADISAERRQTADTIPD